RLATDGSFRPSSRLIQEAVRQQDTVLHVWTKDANVNGSFTQDSNLDWAFCTPVPSETARGWAIYLAGRFASSEAAAALNEGVTAELIDDMKFTALVASIWGALQQVKYLKHWQASLSQFFSPAVLSQLSKASPSDALKPCEAEVTVLFCDLRGFSREAEKRELLPLLEGVSRALGVMTQNILDQGGV